MTRSVVLVVALVLASLPLAGPASAAAPCRYHAGGDGARVRAQPYGSARTVGVLSPGDPARGACGRVWTGAREWTRLDRPMSGYVASTHVRRA